MQTLCFADTLIVFGIAPATYARKSSPSSGALSDPVTPSPSPPSPPSSQVNLYQLTFGTVCGVCAGVFVKKGAKALAFVLGGVYVLLQVSSVRFDADTCKSEQSPIHST